MNVNLAVLGAGRIGKVHAQAIASNKHATLSAIADSFEEAATALAQEHGAVVLSIEDIETASDIDGVIICTPTHTHADLIERFARAGKAKENRAIIIVIHIDRAMHGHNALRREIVIQRREDGFLRLARI